MAIELYWDDEYLSTLLCVFDGKWNWNELFSTLDAVGRITRQLDHEVAAIVDVRKAEQFPGGMVFTQENMSNLRRMLKLNQGKTTGPIFIVGGTRVIKSVYDMVKGLDANLAAKVHFVETQQQARDILYQYRVGASA